MELPGGVNLYDSDHYGFGYIDTIRQQRAAATARQQDTTPLDRDQSIFTHQRVMRMREAVQSIKPEMLEPSQVQVASPASATSASSLGLNTTATSATLQSTEEINTTPTSFSPSQPQWTGSSTAQATISGEYDGSNGTDTLTLEVSRQGSHGSQNLQVKVYDSNNTELDTIDIHKNDPIDSQYALSNGLVFSLGEGSLARNDTFTIDVYDSVGTAVNSDNPFNGTGNDDPNLEEGFSVSDGSFDINGTTIAVNAGDSINDVLNRISQSDAGVTATFDAASETVQLTQKTAGAAQDIVLAIDTSGFVAATKLDGATTTPGTDNKTDLTLAEVGAFSAVQSGSISVNGVAIDIDVDTDSLNDIIDRISASEAGVQASFDSSSQRVSVSAESTASQMELSGGGTQFFTAVGISEGTYNAVDDLIEAPSVKVSDVTDRVVDAIVEENSEKPWEQTPTVKAAPVSATNSQMLTSLVGSIASSMNTLFEDSAFEGAPSRFLENARNGIRNAISSWSGSEGPQFNTDFGINFDFDKTKEGVFNFGRAEQQQFKSALATPEGAAEVRNALFGQDSDGLFNRLHNSLTASAAGLESENNATGVYLDISV